MQTAKNLNDISSIKNVALRRYIAKKATQMMEEYGVQNLDDIGCFVVLEQSEHQQFDVPEMEFVEVVYIENEVYLHGVKIIGDSYGEDTYLTVGVVEC
jgi:hypothetical protein